MEAYGEDGDTITLNDPKDEKIKLSEIYKGETGNGTNGAESEKIKELEMQLAEEKEKVKQLKEEVATGKALIASAITEKGVETDANASFETMANNTKSIMENFGKTMIDSKVYRGSRGSASLSVNIPEGEYYILTYGAYGYHENTTGVTNEIGEGFDSYSISNSNATVENLLTSGAIRLHKVKNTAQSTLTVNWNISKSDTQRQMCQVCVFK